MARRRKHPVVRLEGADQLNKALRSVGNRAGGLVLQNAAKAGAEVISEEAKRLAPKDSGDLAEGIDIEVHRLQHGRTQVNIAPGKRQWYGRLVELGTEKMSAHPYLRPALDSKAEEATNTVGQELRAALKGVLS